MLTPQQPIMGLTLYSHTSDYISHRVRLALAYKEINYSLILVDDDDRPADLADLNPYNTLPTLLDRDVRLYHANIMLEFLDDRYRQRPLLPDSPAERALHRQYAWRIEQDWLVHAHTLLTHPDSFNAAEAEQARAQLLDSLITLAPLFKKQPFFINDHFGYLDCLIAPMLWRMQQMSIVLPAKQCEAIFAYCARIFALPAFIRSLTPAEKHMFKHNAQR